RADGRRGRTLGTAARFRVAPQQSYYIGIGAAAKTPYTVLSPPDLNGSPAAQSTTTPPFPSAAFAAAIEPALEPSDLVLLTTGASGLASSQGKVFFEAAL